MQACEYACNSRIESLQADWRTSQLRANMLQRVCHQYVHRRCLPTGTYLLSRDILIIMLIVFLLYEYAITFDKEVEHFWGRRPNYGTLFFLFNRYSPLVIKALDLTGFSHMSNKVSISSIEPGRHRLCSCDVV